MTFEAWLNKQCSERAKKLTDYESVILNFKFPALKLNNGVHLSVQASEFHGCSPKETLKENEYESVEVHTSDNVRQLMGYEASKCTFTYVPISVMEEICKENGGIKDD